MRHSRVVNDSDIEPSIHHVYQASIVRRLVRKKKILDIGCWTGQFLSLIERGSMTYGIDIDKQAIRLARRVRRGEYKIGSALDLPFRSGIFDVVTMWDVIEHLPVGNEKKAMSEVFKVLKPGGYFILDTVYIHPLSVFFDPAFYLLGHRHYSARYLVRLFDESNFKVKKIFYSGNVWTLVMNNWGLICKHILKRNVGMEFLESKAKNEFHGNGFIQIYVIAQKNF